MALYHEFGTPTYITRRYSPAGEKIRDYEMIMNYWFPSLPLFPQGMIRRELMMCHATFRRPPVLYILSMD